MARVWIDDDDLGQTRFNFPSWITEPMMRVPGQLSLLDIEPEPIPVEPAPDPIPWEIEVDLHSSEELLDIVRNHPMETDDDSDRITVALLVLRDRGIRFLA